MAGETKSSVERRVLEAARQVFFAHGFHNSSLRAIAKKAGTSESGVLRFYDGKLHLLQCVYASCWADINRRAEKAIAAAAAKDPDPRNLLVEFARATLEDYQADEPMMHFMLTHFGFQDTAGYMPEDEGETDADTEARKEYRRYLTRIYELCHAVAAGQPVFRGAGITGDSLAEMFLAMVNGVEGQWYAAHLEPGLGRPALSIDQALRVLRLFLYQGEAPAHQDAART